MQYKKTGKAGFSFLAPKLITGFATKKQRHEAPQSFIVFFCVLGVFVANYWRHGDPWIKARKMTCPETVIPPLAGLIHRHAVVIMKINTSFFRPVS
jgi:hypothetical protein